MPRRTGKKVTAVTVPRVLPPAQMKRRLDPESTMSSLDIGPPASASKMARTSGAIPTLVDTQEGYTTPPREADVVTIRSTSGEACLIPYPGLMLHDLCARLQAHHRDAQHAPEEMLLCDEAFSHMGLECQLLTGLV